MTRTPISNLAWELSCRNSMQIRTVLRVYGFLEMLTLSSHIGVGVCRRPYVCRENAHFTRLLAKLLQTALIKIVINSADFRMAYLARRTCSRRLYKGTIFPAIDQLPPFESNQLGTTTSNHVPVSQIFILPIEEINEHISIISA
jgi:hypothetical protein